MNTLSLSGELTVTHRKGIVKAPLSWRIRNTLRWGFIWGWFTVKLAHAFSKVTGIVTLTSQLAIVLHHNGQDIDYGIVGYRVVTTTGVNWLVDAWQGTYEPETMKYHGCGTGTGNEAVGDTALGTECTTALNPDSTRATGSLTEGATNNVFKTVGTLTFDADAAVTEHGLFYAASGATTMWDRTKFTAVNVVGASADQITFTYELTITAGS